MANHPNRRNLDNKVFLDFDEILVLFPVQTQYVTEQEPQILKTGYAVDGYTKAGLNLKQVLGSFLFEDKKSGKVDECLNFITVHWLNK